MPMAQKFTALPTLATLRKYGMTVNDFLTFCREQEWRCPICREPLTDDRKLAIDHAHVKGWRARKLRTLKNGTRAKVRVMPPAERRLHVRGVLHAFCNRFVRSWLTLDRAARIVAYLEDYERRKDAGR